MSPWRSFMLCLAAGCVVPAPDLGFDTSIPDTDDTEVVGETDDTEVPEPVDITVFLLGDGASDDAVAGVLAAEGYTLVRAGPYAAWDGVTPALDGADAVLWLQAARFDTPLAPAANQALMTFVQGGGGLIRTERAAFAARNGVLNTIDNGMPVNWVAASTPALEWTAVQRDHELVDGLPALWTDAASVADVVAVGAAEVIVQSRREQIPLVSFRTDLGGPYLHLNHDLTQTDGTLSAEFQDLLVNAVNFVANP